MAADLIEDGLPARPTCTFVAELFALVYATLEQPIALPCTYMLRFEPIVA